MQVEINKIRILILLLIARKTAEAANYDAVCPEGNE